MFSPRISLFILANLLVNLIAAQPFRSGDRFIQNHHYLETGGGEQNWGILMDQRGVIYVANNDNGILEFDGDTWRSIPVHNNLAVRSLVQGSDGFIYAGLDGEIGRLEPDLQGNLNYRSLMDSTLRSDYSGIDFWRTYFHEGKIFFCSMRAILLFDIESGGISVIDAPDNAFLTYLIDSHLYTSTTGMGLTKYVGNQFVPVNGGSLLSGKNISGLLPLDAGRFLASTFNQKLYLLDTIAGSVDSTFMDPVLMEELATAGMIYLQNHGENFYLGTREQGLYVLNSRWEVRERVSEEEGLLSNFVPYFVFDTDSAGHTVLWMALWNGISRVDIDHPFRSYSTGPTSRGIYGRGRGEQITDLDRFGEDLYVSTQYGLLQKQDRSGHIRFRPVRGIREELNDLQVMEPSPGVSFLLAAGNESTFVIDREMGISTLQAGGRKLLVDRSRPDVFYTGTDHFKAFRYKMGRWEEFMDVDIDGYIGNMCQDDQGSIWISTMRDLLRLKPREDADPEIRHFESYPGIFRGALSLFTDPENPGLRAGTSEGILRLDTVTGTFAYDSTYNSILPEGNNNIRNLYLGPDNLYLFSFENEYSNWNILAAKRTDSGFQEVHRRELQTLSSRVPADVFYTDPDGHLWFTRANEIIHFDPNRSIEDDSRSQILIRKVTINGDSVVFNGNFFTESASGELHPASEQSEETTPRLKHIYRDIQFEWAAPYCQNQRQIRYSYLLNGFSKNWAEWSHERSAKYTNLPFGKYELQVKATNIYEEESPIFSYSFSILRPWYLTFVAIFLYALLLASLVVFVILYTRRLRSRAELLAKQNREIELQKQELELLNEETTSQRDEIERQRDSISEQKELIDQQNNAMTDSIQYAKRIQDAVLPAKEVMRYLLPKHFVFYRPRDIVSGDFYWVDKRDDSVLVAVADCTGHGVPGAFMSMLGISLLNEISTKFTSNPTNEIMDELRDRVIAALGQTGDRYETKDGIEMSLVAINTTTREVQFTGAGHNLYTFQHGELVIVNGDTMPVGIHSESSTLFSAKTIKLNRGDTLYMFSDGFIDQFGGNKRKKYGTQQLKTLLTQLQNNIMLDQKAVIEKTYEDWKGNNEQIDDVLMVGIKL
jgi:serine phosphatase RsbU (regulator of sigma subunit)